MSAFEENEISVKAQGGTEIAKRKLAEILDSELLSHFQIVCSRHRELDPEKIRLFWCHDLPEDPESNKFRNKSFKDQYHKLVFISNWQYQRYQLIHGVEQNLKSQVIESGIEPAPESALEKNNDTIHIVYTSTPQRGLEILIPVFDKLCEVHDNIHLDVFSSFKIYGWDDADAKFEPLYNMVRNHPKMTYHGFVPNADLKEHLNKSHIFAYPSIWLETSCRAMLEAMSAGLICVHPNLAALPETSGGLNFMYQSDMNDMNVHANMFASYLNAAVNVYKEGGHHETVRFNKYFVDRRYNLNMIKAQWENMLKNLLEQYPTVESRAVPKEQFVYKV